MTRQKILITGASSGLGEGMALQFAEMGRDLALCARRTDRLDEVAQQVRGSAASVAVQRLDVTEIDTVPTVFRSLQEQMGGVDRIIVNAGLGKGAPLGTGKSYANLETINTNLIGALAQVEAAMEIFREQGSGHLVLISSISAVRGLPKAQAAYSASKAGLSALGEGLQAELAGSPIAVSVMLPGYIDTDINRGVKTTLKVGRDAGVAALVAAIEKEKARAAIPSWPWTGIDLALRFLPASLSRRLV